MAELHDDLTSIAAGVQRVTQLPAARELRERGDRRLRRRAAVTGAGLVVLVAAVGAGLLQLRDTPAGPAVGAPSAAASSVTTSAGPQDVLAGRRQVRIAVPSMPGAVLAIGPGDDRVRATAEPVGDPLWVLRPEGDRFRIELAVPREGGRLCMTVVHDAAPGSVRGRACDPASQEQLFTIEPVADGTWSLFQGRRYVQVVDGPDTLVPDLPENLTTTYTFEDRGPS
ncbi:hypothetical protein Cme02nite_17770 [Catellatospora methionotrophica]|uniref:Uncharacterized protein n=1 Tax=Catellatospora methionotrophica TaxID=121620 RepID=A0A8J3L6X2_9ACTN|nr:hypothetical protein [Catellatospora methionotrophica]GIG13445.1 hypothetical protein Cme02nite_17770 [Catellatospora methionotrophica]